MGVEKLDTYQGIAPKRMMNATIVARKVIYKGTVQIWTAKTSADLIQLATSAVRKVTFSGIVQRMALEMHLV